MKYAPWFSLEQAELSALVVMLSRCSLSSIKTLPAFSPVRSERTINLLWRSGIYPNPLSPPLMEWQRGRASTSPSPAMYESQARTPDSARRLFESASSQIVEALSSCLEL